MPIYQKCPDGNYYILYKNGNRRRTTEQTYLNAKKRTIDLKKAVKQTERTRKYRKEYYQQNKDKWNK